MLNPFIWAKVYLGPIVPNPGPTFPSEAIVALAEDNGSEPAKVIRIVPRIKIKRYRTTNEIIEILVFSRMGLPLSLICVKELG